MTYVQMWQPAKRDYYLECLVGEKLDEFYKFQYVLDKMGEEIGGYLGFKIKEYTLDLVNLGFMSPYIVENEHQLMVAIQCWSFSKGKFVFVNEMNALDKQFFTSMIDVFMDRN